MKKVNTLKVGILGGGQLAKMLIPECLKLDVNLHILDPDSQCSASPWCKSHTIGDFRNFDDVYNFGKDMDVLGIEIEQVNIQALDILEKKGVKVIPSASVINKIQNKGTQKILYAVKGLPTSAFRIFESASAIKKAFEKGELELPFVQKSCKGGYDGKGVLVVRQQEQLDNLLEGESVVEDLVTIKKELSVIVCHDGNGNYVTFPTVEMVFDDRANLVDYTLSPAQINAEVEAQAQNLALEVIQAFDMTGILAVELFLTHNDELLINEVAPRVHNSGHHTIEANISSQFEQYSRILVNMPLSDTSSSCFSTMVNLVGEPGYSGTAIYEGVEELLSIPKLSLHLYGKKETRPFRKMGHFTIVGDSLQEVLDKTEQAKKIIKVIA